LTPTANAPSTIQREEPQFIKKSRIVADFAVTSAAALMLAGCGAGDPEREGR